MNCVPANSQRAPFETSKMIRSIVEVVVVNDCCVCIHFIYYHVYPGRGIRLLFTTHTQSDSELSLSVTNGFIVTNGIFIIFIYSYQGGGGVSELLFTTQTQSGLLGI